jgi:hypothetical protein
MGNKQCFTPVRPEVGFRRDYKVPHICYENMHTPNVDLYRAGCMPVCVHVYLPSLLICLVQEHSVISKKKSPSQRINVTGSNDFGVKWKLVSEQVQLHLRHFVHNSATSCVVFLCGKNAREFTFYSSTSRLLV